MGSDVLILTIYFLVVIYVLYQMALSLEAQLEEKVKVDLNLKESKDNIDAQIEKLQLDRVRSGQLGPEDSVGISVKVIDTMALAARLMKKAPPGFNMAEFKKMPKVRRLEMSVYEGEGLEGKITLNAGPTGKLSKGALQAKGRYLTLELGNRTLDTQVFVDWDRSSITYLSAESKRAIRVVPNMSWEPQHRQVFSVINPGENLRANVTTEKSFVRNKDTQHIEPKKALINVDELVMLAMPGMKEFEALRKRGMFSINAMLGLRQLAEPDHMTRYLLVPFYFNVELLEDEIAFPPLKWLLDRPERRPGNVFNTMVLGRRRR